VLERLTRGRLANWRLPIVISITLAVAQLGGPAAVGALRYQRDAVLQGEVWRLVTGHLVHANAVHLGWNVAGLVLVWLLFAGEYTVGGWLAVMLASTAAIDLGFLWNEPGLEWYVGSSGVLHGMVAAGLIAWLHERRDPLTLAVLGVFVAKLAWEHWRGPLPMTADTIGVPVVHAAHSYGALGGAAAALWLNARRTRAGSMPRRSL
jgi:rhomboid family GlyGly-CTERM serine protease